MTKIITLKTAALAKAKDGVTAIEYGLIAGFVALVIIGGITVFGQNLNTFFTNLAARVAALSEPSVVEPISGPGRRRCRVGGPLLSHAMILVAKMILVASLAGAATVDLARREIPDTCSLAVLGAALLLVAAEPHRWPEGLLALTAGLALFAAGAALFFAGVWGGGDVKLAAAVGAWVGWSGLPSFLLVMGLTGGALALLILALRPLARFVPWLAAERGIPYGVAIAAAGIVVPPAVLFGG
jgi:prepilin peptidase CpaA